MSVQFSIHGGWDNFYARFNVEAHIAGGGVAISTSELAHAALGLGQYSQANNLTR